MLASIFHKQAVALCIMDAIASICTADENSNGVGEKNSSPRKVCYSNSLDTLNRMLIMEVPYFSHGITQVAT